MKPSQKQTNPPCKPCGLLPFLAIAAIMGAIAVYWFYQPNPSANYPQGEKLKDVTSKLSLKIPKDAPYPRFTDVTKEAGLTFPSFSGPRSSQLPEDMGSGAAWGDYDNDGDDDLFLVSSGGALGLPEMERAPSVLFENLGDGTFRKVDDFPETRIIGMAAAWADYDADGWLDLAVTGYNSLILFQNHKGRFEAVKNFPAPAGFWAGVSWGDFDNDLDLDLYVCGYVRYQEVKGEGQSNTRQYGREVPYTLNPSSYKPERNLLFRNNGDGGFTEVAEELGVSNPEGRSLGALWHDFNDDGLLDLYVANDISDNVFYLNQGGKFREISHKAWVSDYRGAMGLAVGDWNGDGDDDLFITHWIAQENALYDSLFADKAKDKGTAPSPAPQSASSQEPSRKNEYDQLRFMDVADMVGLGQVALRKIGWGTEFADLDSDGWLDLVVVNGSTFETDDVPPRLVPQVPFLFWNRQGKSFHDIAPLHTPLAEPRVGRGLALSDYDNDGDLDFVLMDGGQGARLFRNDMKTGNWATVRLRNHQGGEGTKNGSGEGAQLVATVDGRVLRRSVGGASYLSQSSKVLHFGLGEAGKIHRLEVNWLVGGQDVYHDLEANTGWELTEGNPTPIRVEMPGSSRQSSVIGVPAEPMNERERLTNFWKIQRSATRALKAENDPLAAIALFQKALSLNPGHEDSLYYLGQCLVKEGRLEESLNTFEKLFKANPMSHRGYRQWGFLRAQNAKTWDDLLAAEIALEKALEINSEETGVMLLLAEIGLLKQETNEAEKRLDWVCRSNPQSATAFFLRAYLAWKNSDANLAKELLKKAGSAGKKGKKPVGSTTEGDVVRKMHSDSSLLSLSLENWDGKTDDLANTFSDLDKHVTQNLKF